MADTYISKNACNIYIAICVVKIFVYIKIKISVHILCVHVCLLIKKCIYIDIGAHIYVQIFVQMSSHI